MPERRYICEVCEGEFVTPMRSGPLPRRCDEHGKPRSVEQRARRHRGGPQETRQELLAERELARAEIRRLREDLRTARRQLTMAERGTRTGPRAAPMSEAAIFDEVETRARQFGPPGPDAVKRCLFRLRHAEGASGTADAADDLARALIVWARMLRLTSSGRNEGEHPDSEARRGRARAA